MTERIADDVIGIANSIKAMHASEAEAFTDVYLDRLAARYGILRNNDESDYALRQRLLSKLR